MLHRLEIRYSYDFIEPLTDLSVGNSLSSISRNVRTAVARIVIDQLSLIMSPLKREEWLILFRVVNKVEFKQWREYCFVVNELAAKVTQWLGFVPDCLLDCFECV
jgi:hypothetical protein